MRMFRALKNILVAAGILALLAALFLFAGRSAPRADAEWGMNFSEKHAKNLGLDPREVYSAFLDDLGVRKFKIAVHWDLLEPERGRFEWTGTDWQMSEAAKRGAEILPVIGLKVPRWPECHLPAWAAELGVAEREEALREFMRVFVERYRENPSVSAWQVENEPFFSFGECPARQEGFLEREMELVRAADPGRPIVISDTGEYSLWWRAARLGDAVGTTLYRRVWFKQLGIYASYPWPPVFYARRAWLVEKLFGKEVWDVELQAEPWGPVLYYDLPLEEQEKSMTLEQFRKNVDFARRTGFREHYFWGGEWWYWMKEKQGEDAYWQEAKSIFRGE